MSTQSVKDLIGLWPSRAVLAAETGASLDRIHKWAASGSIPGRWWGRLLASAAARELSVTANDLVRLHDRPASTPAEDAA